MAHNIKSEALSWSDEAHPTYVSEASTLGFRPGEWPSSLQAPFDIGNGAVFVISEEKRVDGEIVYVRYRQLIGSLDLIVFND